MSAKYNNILRVGGITLPDPSKMSVDDYDISESERNAKGYMISQMIREDVHKLVCEWALLRPEEYRIIRKAIKKKFGLQVYFSYRMKVRVVNLTCMPVTGKHPFTLMRKGCRCIRDLP